MRNNIILIMKTIKKQQVVELRKQPEIIVEKDSLMYIMDPLPELPFLIADLYPILEDTEIPEEALDPTIWNIPNGYYAIESKNLD